MTTARLQQLKSPTLLLSLMVVSACTIRFLIDGISFFAFGHIVNLPHTDPMAYGAILAPVLGAHGYIHGKLNAVEAKDE